MTLYIFSIYQYKIATFSTSMRLVLDCYILTKMTKCRAVQCRVRADMSISKKRCRSRGRPHTAGGTKHSRVASTACLLPQHTCYHNIRATTALHRLLTTAHIYKKRAGRMVGQKPHVIYRMTCTHRCGRS